jgi:hypothetical protein
MPESKKRPSLQRKVTPKSEKNRKEALDQGIAITVDGERYEVRIGDVTPAMSRDLRRETGFGTFGLIGAMTSKALDLDILQAFMWLARRIRGEDVELDDCEIDYELMLDDKRFSVDGDTGEEDTSTNPED